MSRADERIADALARRSSRARAPAGFDQRLWAAIDAEAQPARPRSSARTMAIASAAVALAVAAAVALIAWPDDRAQPPSGPTLAIAVQSGDAPIRRSTAAQPGDRAVVTARLDAALHAELRLYRDDDDLVVACSDAPPCTRSGDALEAALPLDTAGVYQIVLLHGDGPLPAPTGDLDRDVAAAIEAGADATLRRLVVH